MPVAMYLICELVCAKEYSISLEMWVFVSFHGVVDICVSMDLTSVITIKSIYCV